MKVNLKKMGAILAGATILASSAAFAGLMYGSTTLVDANGAPTAKVVLGSKSAPSDGVAGGLIVGAMAGATYKTDTLTASVSGTATCAAEENGEAAGTCTISDEKARLEITVPGAVAAGTWTGDNLIGDFLNRELLDREPNADNKDADQAYELDGSDTSDNANPFVDGVGGDLGVSKEFMFRIDGDVFTTFEDMSLTDVDAGNTYVEMQNMWLEGNNRFDDDPDDIVGKLEFLAYTIKFDGPGGDEMGVPVCVDSENNDYAYCKSAMGDIDDATETHRLKVYAFGEEWIISEMNAPTDSDPDPNTANDGITTETELVNGGSIKLAKESVGGILNQGEFLQVDDLKFQLDDLEAHGGVTNAIISVLDANDNVIEKDKIGPGATKEMMINGKEYRFHVYKVAPGYTFGAKWADVAIYSHEIECEDGQELDSDENTNPSYECALGWKNLDASPGVEDVNGANPEEVDTLRTIIIWSDDIEDISSSGEDTLEQGDYVSIVEEPVAWKLSYKGLDITSEDRHSLKFELETSDDKDISENKGPLDDILFGGAGDQTACRIYAPYIEVSSGDSGGVFRVARDDAGGDLADNEFYIAINTDPGNPYPATCDDDGPGGSVDTDLPDYDFTLLEAGSVFMHISASSSDYGVAMYGGANQPYGDGMLVEYEDIGDGDSNFAPPEGGAILIQQLVDVIPGDDKIGSLLYTAGGDFAWDTLIEPDLFFGVAEKAGTASSNEFVDYFIFGVDRTDDSSLATFDFDSSMSGFAFPVTSNDEEVLYGHATSNKPDGGPDAEYYCDVDPLGVCSLSPLPLASGPVEPGVEMVEEGYVSERGSVFELIDSDKVEFDMSHKLAMAQWWLGPSETAEAGATSTVVTLGEGEETTVGGVTVKVLEITETVGPCGANGGAVACVADMSGVSAVIMPNNAPSVDVAVPYTGDYGNLVILDTDAVGVNTLVSVGGDKVNSVTAELLQGSAVDWSAETKVVKEVVVGSKIVVAGRDAADTLDAAKDFVAALQKT